MGKGKLVVSIYIVLSMIVTSFMVMDIEEGFGIKKAGSTALDSHEKIMKASMEAQQDVSARIAWVDLHLGIIIYPGHDISGIGLPKDDGYYRHQWIFRLQWTNASTTINRSISIIPFYPISSFQGVTTGKMGIFIGIVNKATLLGATNYHFKGWAIAVNIPY